MGVEEGDLGQGRRVHVEGGGIGSGTVGQVVDDGRLGPYCLPGPEYPGAGRFLCQVVDGLDQFTVDDVQDAAGGAVVMGPET